MKIALIGYGKMGRMLEQLAPQYGGEIGLRLDEFNNANFEGITADNFLGIDVAIDFSIPRAAMEIIQRTSALGVNLVVGTTGWLAHVEEAKAIVAKHAAGLVWSANFSPGVNAFFRLAAEAARLLASQTDYEAWAYEIHHSAKIDAPSGTLLKLVEEMKKSGYGRRIDISSSRAGAHPGTHEIGFDSSADTITLRHVARNREGFARGALRAAQWVIGKRGFYEFSDIVFS
jgi:4-hydroxy-tetrahydrodipicolinate reductase